MAPGGWLFFLFSSVDDGPDRTLGHEQAIVLPGIVTS
jgi:hypothetical protein